MGDSRPPGVTGDIQLAWTLEGGAPFSGRRLRLARQYRGLTQLELARALGTIVSGPAISQYENGQTRRPGIEIVARFSDLLGFDPSFFFPPEPQRSLPDRTPFFRKQRGYRARDMEAVSARAQLAHLVARSLTAMSGAAPASIPRYDVPSLDAGAIERVANQVRRDWKIGFGPIGDMVQLLESHGAIVLRASQETNAVDACCVAFEDRPIIVLRRVEADPLQTRFDLAHELGHIVLHADQSMAPRNLESQAERFASALLMPVRTIRAALPSLAHPDELARLRVHWGVSFAALLRRAREVQHWNPTQCDRVSRDLESLGWMPVEPRWYGPFDAERPIWLHRCLEALQSRGETLESIQQRLGLTPRSLEELTGWSLA